MLVETPVPADAPLMGGRAETGAEHAVQQLAALGDVHSRAMSPSTTGLYLQDTMFGVIHDGRVYLRTNQISAERYLQAGERALSLTRENGRRTFLPFHSVPHDVQADDAQFTEWARDAVAHASQS
jgi:TfoX/Sxy family transcriptional regulator of competence genes